MKKLLPERINRLRQLLDHIDNDLARWTGDERDARQGIERLSELADEVASLLGALSDALRLHIDDCEKLCELFEREREEIT